MQAKNRKAYATCILVSSLCYPDTDVVTVEITLMVLDARKTIEDAVEQIKVGEDISFFCLVFLLIKY